MKRFQGALAALSRSVLKRASTLDEVFGEITEVIADALPVERVGIWLFDESRSAIELTDLYERSSGTHSRGVTLSRVEYPRYFAALDADRSIAADDALNDPRTSEFAQDYLPAFGIGSLLDAPVRVDGVCVGVVCHEHVGPPRRWTPTERMFAGSAADITALALETYRRRRAEAALREREEELRAALEAARMGTWSWDVETGALDWSEEVSFLFGRPGWVPTFEGYLEALHPADREGVENSIRAAIAGVEGYRVQHRVVLPDGTVRWLEGRGSVVSEGGRTRMRGTVADVTERVTLEQSLQQAQRLEGLGRLAGGIAHDFNNLLTVIVCAASELELVPDEPAEVTRNGEEILEAAEVARKLTTKLLAFARKQPSAGRRSNATELLRSTVSMLERLVGEHIEVRCDVPDDPLWVPVDESAFGQILVNLAVNARDAMPSGGTLSLSLQHDPDAPGGDLGRGVARLRVADTGVGIDEEALPHVFEPFFTTKAEGEGTGLGLSICYGVARQAGGDMSVRSGPEGTEFEVTLPVVADEEPALRPKAPPESAPAPATARVLVVEDERLIRDRLVRILEHEGHVVTAVASGTDAIAAAGEAERIDLVVCDVVVPGTHGEALFRRLHEAQPAARILAMSGYADETGREGVDRYADAFLAKPFSAPELLDLARTLLERSSPRLARPKEA
ncbi:MAG: ATP-binding protein [Myxococcota bacterium]|nr:ATP-binding protein [Myxococcota bacterium]